MELTKNMIDALRTILKMLGFDEKSYEEYKEVEVTREEVVNDMEPFDYHLRFRNLQYKKYQKKLSGDLPRSVLLVKSEENFVHVLIDEGPTKYYLKLCRNEKTHPSSIDRLQAMDTRVSKKPSKLFHMQCAGFNCLSSICADGDPILCADFARISWYYNKERITNEFITGSDELSKENYKRALREYLRIFKNELHLPESTIKLVTEYLEREIDFFFEDLALRPDVYIEKMEDYKKTMGACWDRIIAIKTAEKKEDMNNADEGIQFVKRYTGNNEQ